jgi:hypothetical protein
VDEDRDQFGRTRLYGFAAAMTCIQCGEPFGAKRNTDDVAQVVNEVECPACHCMMMVALEIIARKKSCTNE